MLRRYRDVGYDSARWAEFDFRDGDIVISAPPKCGTTWVQMLVAMLVFDSTDLPASLSSLSPWLDMQTRSIGEVRADLEAQDHRRFIKTHTPLDGLPLDERVTYVTIGRDPRDIAISWMSQMTNVDRAAFMAQRQAAVGLDDLPELARPASSPVASEQEVFHRWFDFDDETTTYGLRGAVHHLATFWECRDDANVVLLHYADLSSDLEGQIALLASRLGVSPSARALGDIAVAATFEAMKRRADQIAPNAEQGIWKSNADFFRRGGHGQWREIWDEETVKRYDKRVAALAEPALVHWMENGSRAQP